MKATIVIDGDRVVLKSFDGRDYVKVVPFIDGNIQSLNDALGVVVQAAVAQNARRTQRRLRNVD